MAQYKVNKGIEYLGKRAEAGETVSDLPPKAIKWLRECDAIELVSGNEELADEVATVEEPVEAPIEESIEEIDPAVEVSE